MTYSEIHPSAVHDGESDKGHHADTHQEVADGQVHDQHRRHRVESLGRSHDDDDKNITYAERHTHTNTQRAHTHTGWNTDHNNAKRQKSNQRVSRLSFSVLLYLHDFLV